MAPEQFSPHYGPEVDVWSFAFLMYEMATRCIPFDELADDGFAGMTKYKDIAEEGYRSPIPAEIPIEISELITSCWNLSPQKRPTFAKIISICESLLVKYANQPIALEAIHSKCKAEHLARVALAKTERPTFRHHIETNNTRTRSKHSKSSSSKRVSKRHSSHPEKSSDGFVGRILDQTLATGDFIIPDEFRLNSSDIVVDKASILGKGGFCTVYKGTFIKEPVAIKYFIGSQ